MARAEAKVTESGARISFQVKTSLVSGDRLMRGLIRRAASDIRFMRTGKRDAYRTKNERKIIRAHLW